MQRAGNRRYYRPADVDLARRIHRLLNEQGYTVRGVQKLLRDKDVPAADAASAPAPIPQPAAATAAPAAGVDVMRLINLRDRLVSALDL